jgi:hypothetical protein
MRLFRPLTLFAMATPQTSRSVFLEPTYLKNFLEGRLPLEASQMLGRAPWAVDHGDLIRINDGGKFPDECSMMR